jgi:hypothetical protein
MSLVGLAIGGEQLVCGALDRRLVAAERLDQRGSLGADCRGVLWEERNAGNPIIDGRDGVGLDILELVEEVRMLVAIGTARRIRAAISGAVAGVGIVEARTRPSPNR